MQLSENNHGAFQSLVRFGFMIAAVMTFPLIVSYAKTNKASAWRSRVLSCIISHRLFLFQSLVSFYLLIVAVMTVKLITDARRINLKY